MPWFLLMERNVLTLITGDKVRIEKTQETAGLVKVGQRKFYGNIAQENERKINYESQSSRKNRRINRSV